MAARIWLHERRAHLVGPRAAAVPASRLRTGRGVRLARRWAEPSPADLRADAIGTRSEDVQAQQCETCGSVSHKTFQLILDGATHVFDSFECAITGVAPSCERCGCRVLGHGVDHDGALYCSDGCRRRDLGSRCGDG